MITFYVEVDPNDGDYVGHLVTIPKKDFERFKPLIEKIKNFIPYEGVSNDGYSYKHYSNFPTGDVHRPDLGEKSPQELYNITDEECEEFIDLFNLYSGVEWGFHTINKIIEVEIKQNILWKT